MSDSVGTGQVIDLLTRVHALVDELNTADLTRCAGSELLELLRSMETLRRRLDFAGYRVIREAEGRGLPHDEGQPTMARLLRRELRLDAAEASARTRAAAAVVGFRTPTGEAVEPAFVQVAAAQAAGEVSQKQALIIENTIDALPDDVQAERGARIETDLVGHARCFDAGQLAKMGQHLRYLYDQDGALVDLDRQQARRSLTMSVRPDGSARLEGDTTIELTELLQTVLDTTAAPLPAVDGVQDQRSTEQRNHDGLIIALQAAVRAGELPAHNGAATTIVVTMATEQYLTGTGLARTGHGHLVPATEALQWGGGDAQVLAAAIGSMRAISHYGHTHRIFTENQKHAMTARDHGCTAPGCPEPPSRCQSHHLIDHAAGGTTTVRNGALVCRWHHRELIRTGWHATLINGRVHWLPPKSIDAQQRPLCNTLHDPITAA